jgi:hypothetical protein
MKYNMTTPCDACPFLKKMRRGFTVKRLTAFASGEFPCHKTAAEEEDEDGSVSYVATRASQHCAGALLFNERRGRPHQMMRICERLGLYDASKLNMKADVR